MQFGLFAPLANPYTTRTYLETLAAEAEKRGYTSIWVGEHTVMFDEYTSRYPYSDEGRIPQIKGSGVLEPMVVLGYLAAVTKTIRIGTAVCILPQRNPVYAAKEMSTLDWLTEGRVNFGVGVGWLKEEFDAVNVPWPQRGARTNEYLKLIRTLWMEDPSSFNGDFFSLPSCHMFPKPVQSPHPPIYVGGESDAALTRAAQLGQGWIGFHLTPAEASQRIRSLHRFLDGEGRDRQSVYRTVCPWTKLTDPGQVSAYAKAGIEELVLPIAGFSIDELLEAFDRYDGFKTG